MAETGRSTVVSILTAPAPASGCCCDAVIPPGRLSASCRLGRGLSPVPFCYLNACDPFDPRPFQMPTPDHATVSLPDDPALLRIEGPIATITLNRPAAFNSIDLSIAKKLEQLGAEVESSDDIRVLVIEGVGRAFCAGGDLQTIGAAAAADTIAPVVGELLKHYHAFIETVRRMPMMLASRRPTPRSACRRTAAAPSAWWAPSVSAARCRYFLPKTASPRSRRTIGVWSQKLCRRRN